LIQTLLAITAPLAQAAEETPRAAAAAAEAPSPPSEVIFPIATLPFVGQLAVTNTILTAWVVIILLVLFARFSTLNMRLLPSGAQNFWELMVELWVGQVERMMGPRRGRRFLPLIATAFIFIVFSNWFGVLPIVGPITITNYEGEPIPLFRSANSDLNLTAAMAVLMIVLAEAFELRSLGLLGYLKGLLIPNPLRWLEILTRPLSLSMRLFGNIFAGEVLIATMLAVLPFILFVFLALELFVGLIQALIFAMLSLVFLTIATAHEEAHEHEAHPELPQDDRSYAGSLAEVMEQEPH
jgi:F-type H+-transporting ATPase subunit a